MIEDGMEFQTPFLLTAIDFIKPEKKMKVICIMHPDRSEKRYVHHSGLLVSNKMAAEIFETKRAERLCKINLFMTNYGKGPKTQIFTEDI